MVCAFINMCLGVLVSVCRHRFECACICSYIPFTSLKLHFNILGNVDPPDALHSTDGATPCHRAPVSEDMCGLVARMCVCV